MFRRLMILFVVVVIAFGLAPAARADPSNNIFPPLTLVCDNGLTIDASPGTLTNQGHMFFDIDSTSVLVINFFSVTTSSGTFVLLDSAPGLKDLITCTGARDGRLITVKGFVAPRQG